MTLSLSLVQCRKSLKETMSYNDEEVSITLNVGDGSKTDVNPLTGKVTFVDGDELIVANHGVYVGTLVYDDGVFCGTVTKATTNDYLHFYHLGNKDVGKMTAGKTTSCSVSVINQSVSLPVISYAHSTELYNGAGTYTARLSNKCALVKFNVTTSARSTGTCVKGLNNKVVVDFSKRDAANAFSFEQDGDGNITLEPGNGEKWAILLPQDEVPAGASGSAFSGRYSGTRGSIPEINAGDCLHDGIEVTIDEPMMPEGALPYEFSINSQGDKVLFSKSNLQYIINSREWRFYDNQYGMSTTINSYVGTEYRYAQVITHFGFGTSGYNHGAVLYQPKSTTYSENKYYVYGDASLNLCDGNGSADWGQNPITNGMNAGKQWRTLTIDEWRYLFWGRPDAVNKYGHATIEGSYPGVVLLPDSWSAPYEGCFIPGNANAFTTNVYDAGQWQQMEEAGAVFLPAAGRRYDDTIYGALLFSVYWSSTKCDNNTIYTIYYGDADPVAVRTDDRCYGCLVRLVCE